MQLQTTPTMYGITQQLIWKVRNVYQRIYVIWDVDNFHCSILYVMLLELILGLRASEQQMLFLLVCRSTGQLLVQRSVEPHLPPLPRAPLRPLPGADYVRLLQAAPRLLRPGGPRHPAAALAAGRP